VLTFHAEPMREAYRGLLQFALTHSAAFSLVTRHDMKTRQSQDQCLDQLRPFLLDERDVREWPGTRIDGMATLVTYGGTPPRMMRPTLPVQGLLAIFVPSASLRRAASRLAERCLTFGRADGLPA
jgi:hypothetical protein